MQRGFRESRKKLVELTNLGSVGLKILKIKKEVRIMLVYFAEANRHHPTTWAMQLSKTSMRETRQPKILNAEIQIVRIKAHLNIRYPIGISTKCHSLTRKCY